MNQHLFHGEYGLPRLKQWEGRSTGERAITLGRISYCGRIESLISCLFQVNIGRFFIEINTGLHLKVTSSVVVALLVLGLYYTRPTASVQ